MRSARVNCRQPRRRWPLVEGISTLIWFRSLEYLYLVLFKNIGPLHSYPCIIDHGYAHPLLTVHRILCISIWSLIALHIHTVAAMKVLCIAIVFQEIGGNRVLCLASFPICLLAILVLRLHVTFGQTAYRMTKRTRCMLIGIFSALCVLPLVWPITSASVTDFHDATASTHDYPDWHLTVLTMTSLSVFFLFATGSVLTVYHFVNNLRLLSRAAVTSQTTLDGPESDISLNRNQQRYSTVAARSMLLFVTAILTTLFIYFGFVWAFSVSSGVRNIFMSMDFTINLLCVYLQFSFAGEHYQRFCGRLDGVCRNWISNRTRKDIRKLSDGRHNTIQSVSEVELPQTAGVQSK